MTRDEAFALVGLLPGHVAESTIKRAAALRIMALHPDTATEPAPEGVTIERIQAARDLLVSQQHGLPCTLCNGRGKVMVGMAPRDCVACDGTGDRI